MTELKGVVVVDGLLAVTRRLVRFELDTVVTEDM